MDIKNFKIDERSEYSVIKKGDIVRIYYYPDKSDMTEFTVFYSYSEFRKFMKWYS